MSTWTQIGNDIDGEAAGDESGYSVSLSSMVLLLLLGLQIIMMIMEKYGLAGTYVFSKISMELGLK